MHGSGILSFITHLILVFAFILFFMNYAVQRGFPISGYGVFSAARFRHPLNPVKNIIRIALGRLLVNL
jgi:hypothetical protein